MSVLPRIAAPQLQRLVQSFPAIAVLGARQVGKSTLLQHLFGDRFDMVTFDPIVDVGNARHDPELFLANHPPPIILDEIQYCPELIPSIKRYIDRHRVPGLFLLSGSQQWNVMKHLAESLAGRVLFLELEPFSLVELANLGQSQTGWIHAWLANHAQVLGNRTVSRIETKRTLYQQLWRGFFPGVQFVDEDLVADYYQSYLRTYIERDVRLLADISDWQQFSRFVRIVAALTAQEINYSHVGREIGLTPQTAKRWLNTLSATFQYLEIAAYSGNAIKRLTQKPKGYLVDTGLVCALQSISTPTVLAGHPLWGALFETAVVNEIHKQCSTLSVKPNLFHWRSAGNAEVDLILERDGIFFPVEIKAKSRPNGNDARGIGAFRKTYPHLTIANGLVVAPSESMYQVSEHDYVMPWDAFIPAL